MARFSKVLIFISHSSEDSSLACLIQKLFEKSLKVNPKKEIIFCSSDLKSLRMDDVQYERITYALRAAKVILALMTPNSIYRPWVLFEAGGAHFSGLGSAKKNSKSLFLSYANGIDPQSLPAPLQPRQARNLGDENIVRELCKEIAQKLQKSRHLRIEEELVKKISTEATKGIGNWEFVQQALVGEKIAASPFGFENLLSEMRRNMFVAGQSLFHLTNDENRERYKELLYEKLSRKDSKVQILICNPDFKYAVKTWQAVTAKEYKEDLKHSVSVLKKWMKDFKNMKLKGRLDIRKTIIVPLTITFIDPEDKLGKLVFNPVVYQAIGDWRPCYLISKKQHPRVFDYYWTVYKNVFNDKKKTKDILN